MAGRLAGERAAGKLAWGNFWLSNIGVILMIPTLTMILSSAGEPAGHLIAVITVSEVCLVLGLLLFALNVWRMWKKA